MGISILLRAILLGACYASGVVAQRDYVKMIESMTLEEKIGQMVQIDISKFMISGTTTVNYTLMGEWINTYKIGSILNSPFSGGPVDGVNGWTATEWRQLIINMQTFAKDAGLPPIIYGIDSIHGATYIYGSALFPQALGTAASFDRTVAYDGAVISARDTRAAGIPWLFAPVLGLGLQPYWARFSETFGEDMYLAAEMGVATITGMQDFQDDGGVPVRAAACMKHYISYSDPINGHDRSPVQLPDRIMRELYYPSFSAAVKAGVMTAMESYNEVGGVPMVSSKDYLTTLLRQEMNFTGMMVTDYSEILNLYNWHKVSASVEDAVLLSMSETTVDMSMVPLDDSFFTNMVTLVNSGQLPVSRVDESVLRVLRLKDELGMFDDFVPELTDINVNKVGQNDDWIKSQTAAEGSVALVQNTNGLLPLAAATTKVFLTGPTADSLASQSGGWSLHWQGAQHDDEFTNGVSVLGGITKYFTNVPTYMMGPSMYATNITSGVNMTAAHDFADAADVIVICVGEGAYAEKPGDIDSLELPQGQLDYVQDLRDHVGPDKPIVLVIISGRPRLLHSAVAASTAVLNAFAPGPMGGAAIGRILIGEVVPSGRMPYTYPRNAGDIPYQYHHKPGDQCINVYNGQCEVEWNFGFGLSYNNFVYSDFTLSSANIDETGSIDISVKVSNTDDTDAAHSLLVFVFDLYRRVTPEYKLLKKFDKATIKANDFHTFTFTLTAEELQYVGVDSRYLLESGSYYIGVGADVDCRSSNAADQLSVNGGANMCLPFELTLSTSYDAVCEYACDLWSKGLCGVSVTGDQCTAQCKSQSWSWNYVDCLQQYSQAACVGAESIQCYDAFSMVPDNTDSSDSSDGMSKGYAVMLIAVTCVVAFLVGTMLSFCGMRYINRRSLKKALLENDYGQVNGNDDTKA